MQINCKYHELLGIHSLKNHPKNPNKHPEEQIKRLAKLLEYQGFRHPIIVSKLSGYIVVGHGRLEAARLNGWTQVPVEYQEFKDEATEYAFMTSDNAIAEWAELDLGQINTDFLDLGPDFDIDLLGISDFVLEPADKYKGRKIDDISKEWEGMPEFDHEKNDIEKAYHKIIVRFDSEFHLDQFSKLLDQSLTNKILSIWFPEKIRGQFTKNRSYENE